MKRDYIITSILFLLFLVGVYLTRKEREKYDFYYKEQVLLCEIVDMKQPVDESGNVYNVIYYKYKDYIFDRNVNSTRYYSFKDTKYVNITTSLADINYPCNECNYGFFMGITIILAFIVLFRLLILSLESSNDSRYYY